MYEFSPFLFIYFFMMIQIFQISNIVIFCAFFRFWPYTLFRIVYRNNKPQYVLVFFKLQYLEVFYHFQEFLIHFMQRSCVKVLNVSVFCMHYLSHVLRGWKVGIALGSFWLWLVCVCVVGQVWFVKSKTRLDT